MTRRQPREGSGLRRRAPKREPYDRVLIVCEGAKTEPGYFTDLKDHYRLSNANIAITPADGSDPLSVVRKAKDMQAAERRQGEVYDRIYCVFDRDEHTHFEAASQQLGSAGLHPARSWPCFEVWLLLRFAYTREPFARTGTRTAAQCCVSALKAQLPDYRKGGAVFGHLLDRLDQAKQHARQARQDARRTGEDNPSTEVHDLVHYLQHLKDPA